MTFKERKAQRTIEYNKNLGRKTGSLDEIARIKWFYENESIEAQEAKEAKEVDKTFFEIFGSVHKHYDNDR
jgi:hypothetical protein